MKYIILILALFLLLTKKKKATIVFDQGDGDFDFPDENGEYETKTPIIEEIDDYDFDITNQIISEEVDVEAFERKNDKAYTKKDTVKVSKWENIEVDNGKTFPELVTGGLKKLPLKHKLKPIRFGPPQNNNDFEFLNG